MIKLTKNLLILISLLPLSSFAAGVTFEPMYGSERSARLYPKPTTYKTKGFYGIRGTYGVPLLSAELELSQSLSEDSFPETGEKVKYNTQRAMLGIKTYPIASKFFGFYFRTGVRAQKDVTEVTKSAVTTKTEAPMSLDPYGGAGLTIALADSFALSAGATLMYNKNADASEQYDTQYTLSFTMKSGNR
jgi:hypothetical protein